LRSNPLETAPQLLRLDLHAGLGDDARVVAGHIVDLDITPNQVPPTHLVDLAPGMNAHVGELLPEWQVSQVPEMEVGRLATV